MKGSELDEGTGMEAQGDEGTVRHRRKFVVLGTALPAASEARHSGHLLALTGKGLPTRLPRSGLVQVLVSSSHSTVRPVVVVVAAISSMTAKRLVKGRARQFCVIWQKRRCSILFHFDVPGGKWHTEIVSPVSSAKVCSSRFHNRSRTPLEPPQSAVIISRVVAG